MNIEQIRKKWVNHANKDINASICMWNSVSSDYMEKAMPRWESNEFLGLLDDSVQMTKDMTALDIGCGAGTYSIVLAERIDKVIGIDLSPKMISHARKKAETCGVENVEFLCSDWDGFDIDEEGFKESFDIVFAHMTPAICSADTFQKLIDCSKKYCFMAKPTRRRDSVLDEVRKLAGMEENRVKNDTTEYAFSMLWQMGYCPKLSYRDEVWKSEKTLEEAYSWYIGRVKTCRSLSESEELELKTYLNSIAVDGKVYETITTTVVTIYWEK